ncbi:MAG: hypothetical protein HYY16_00655 [Planctomycetes bacterium]|nr:hypothetical protein [Planctomycetota bacterium]
MTGSSDPGNGPEEERKSFLFEMTTPVDAGQGFRVVELPKPPQAPAPPPSPSPPPRAALSASRRSRNRRSFLWGLLLGQIVIVSMNWALRLLLPLLPGTPPSTIERVPLLICMGIVVGIALVGAFIGLVLALTGIVGLFRRGSLKRGLKRVLRAGLSVGVTAAVLGGTAFAMIPSAQWREAPAQAWSITRGGWQRIHDAWR